LSVIIEQLERIANAQERIANNHDKTVVHYTQSMENDTERMKILKETLVKDSNKENI
jgi:hypothetical protein